MLMLDNDCTASVLDARDAVGAIAAVFDELGRGRAADRNKTSIYVPREDPSLWYRYASMDGASRGLGMAAVRLKSDMVRRTPRDGVLRESKYTGRPGTYGGLVLLFSAEDGRLLAILNDGFIQHLRVGATYGVGMDHLARADATTVGMIGSGGMARTCLASFCVVRPIRSVKVYSPTPGNAQRYAEEMAGALGVRVDVVGSAQEAADDVDVLAGTTDAREAVLFADMVRTGMHVTSVTDTYEVDAEAFERFDMVATERTGISEHVSTAPERDDLPYGGSRPHLLERYASVPPDRRVSLHDVIVGNAPGRLGDDEVTYFAAEGMGTQFVALAALAYTRAVERGLGRELPDEWFQQDIRT